MTQTLDIALLPDHLTAERLSGSTVIVIDVLRASTTIIHALAYGANCITPFATVEQAEDAAAASPIGSTLLAGERGGVAVEGFDLGNSPGDYTPEIVGGRTIVFTTTNGTKALEKSKSADRILIGAFVNQQAIVSELTTFDGKVLLVCAGTDGAISAEDVLFAGTLAVSLNKVWGGRVPVSDTARIAMDFFRANSENAARLESIRASRGGQNLIQLGYDKDIEVAASLDLFSTVPEYIAESNELKVSGEH